MGLKTMDIEALKQTAQAMVASGKGILAMDESHPTCAKRFEKLGVPTTQEKRQEYRDMLLTGEGIENYIAAAILFDETIRQKMLSGISFTEHMKNLGIIPGIKVDAGAKPLAGFPGETVTEGLDGLRDRLSEYYELGARFAKWRAVYTISDKTPSDAANMANAHALARYAALCQEANIVPIVEPEVLINGDHTIEQSFISTQSAQKLVFDQLREQGVLLEGIVLKPSMVTSGLDATDKAGVQEVAEKTIECLLSTVPAEVPGIAFLSGGQTDEEASAHLSAMNSLGKDLPWNVTFSYGRALQQAAMSTWNGKAENVDAARKVAVHRARMNGLASLGQYTPELEQQAA